MNSTFWSYLKMFHVWQVHLAKIKSRKDKSLKCQTVENCNRTWDPEFETLKNNWNHARHGHMQEILSSGCVTRCTVHEVRELPRNVVKSFSRFRDFKTRSSCLEGFRDNEHWNIFLYVRAICRNIHYKIVWIDKWALFNIYQTVYSGQTVFLTDEKLVCRPVCTYCGTVGR